MPRFPDGRRMTPAEKRGFDLACDELMVWGQMMASSGRALEPAKAAIETIPLSRLMEHNGNAVTNFARAMQLAGDRDVMPDASAKSLH